MTGIGQVRVPSKDVGSALTTVVERQTPPLADPTTLTSLSAKPLRRAAWLAIVVTVLACGVGRADAATLASCKRDGAAHAARELKTLTNNCNVALTRNTDWGSGSARKTAYQSCLRNAKASAKLTGLVDSDVCEKKFPPPPSSTAPVRKVPGNQAFCNTLIEQFGMFSTYDPTNLEKRKQYALDQMNLNAKLLKLAPSSIRADVTIQVQTANTVYAAMAAGDPAAMRAAASAMQAGPYLAAVRRINQYCNIPVA